MIYVSSSCVKAKKIHQAVVELADHGFKNIELSGGTTFYSELEHDLFELKKKYGLNYLLHNYFPPPQEDFVINLASLNESISKKSFEHLKTAIKLSEILGGRRLALHAGFFFDIGIDEIGRTLTRNQLFPHEAATSQFLRLFRQLSKKAGNTRLYIENNVLSHHNAQTFEGENPFMLTDSAGFFELREQLDFELLLDVAHLKVSSKSLGLDFETELSQLFPVADYIHVSDNDGLSDQNRCLEKNSELMELLKKFDWRGKIITLEIYQPLESVQRSHDLILNELVSDN